MRIVLSLILILACYWTRAQEFSIESGLDTSVIRIGEQTTYRIIARGIEDPEALSWPQIKDTLHRHIEVIEVLPLDTLQAEPPLSMQQAVIITAWDSGHYAIRPYALDYAGQNYLTEALLLSVNTLPVDTTAAPMDIKPIYQEPFSLKDWLKMNWPYLAALLIAILVVILILRIKRKGRVDVFGPPPVVLIPAHVKALQRLTLLDENEQYARAEKKVYYSELTETLRAYLEERYKIKALEQTSAEILQGIRYLGLNAEQIDSLRAILYTADMVKFAKEKPADTIAQNHLERAFAFIAATQLEEEVEESPTKSLQEDE